MVDDTGLRTMRIPLNRGPGRISAAGFGTLDAGFRYLDYSERYHAAASSRHGTRWTSLQSVRRCA
jgi:hypothetical protein